MIEEMVQWLVNMVDGLGYVGLFILTFVGNTGIPIPLEVIMIPAGYLVHQGEMNGLVVIITAIAGDIAGSLAGYYIAAHFGRRFLYAFGKYFFISHEKIDALDRFFTSHGQISVLTGRLTPGLRHFMAFPAGLAHMQLKKFITYTGIGGGLWIATLVTIGYFIGHNKHLIREYMPYITLGVVVLVVMLIVVYTVRHRKQSSEKSDGPIG